MVISEWLKNKVIALTLATSSVEKNALGGEKNMLSDDSSSENVLEHQRLSHALKQGVVTQEVKDLRWRMYKILNHVSEYKTEIIGTEKDEAMDTRYITKTSKTSKVNMSKFTVEPSDSYPLEIIINNEKIINGYVETLNNKDNIENGIAFDEFNSTEKTKNLIFVNREFPTKFNIEDYTEKVHIRGIDGGSKIIEFYVSKYVDEYDRKTRLLVSEIKKSIDNPRLTNIYDVNGFGFLSSNKTVGVQSNRLFEYRIDKFDKVVEFGGFYVIKFIANELINGDFIFEKYRMDDLDVKYENREQKDIK